MQYSPTICAAEPLPVCEIGRMPKNTKSKEHKEYVLPQEEFQRILARFPEGTSSYLPLMVGYYLGTRISETYGIDLLHNLDLENMRSTSPAAHQGRSCLVLPSSKV